MRGLVNAFWRAAAYCLHPKLIFGSLAPVLLAAGAVFGLGWFFWQPAVAAVQQGLDQWPVAAATFDWLDGLGLTFARSLVAPLAVVLVAVPVVVVMSLLLVALLMTPVIVGMVATRRFPALERKRGAGGLRTVVWSLGCTVIALFLLVLSLPLWLVPPVALVLPPLIWGWLTYRVFAFEVLAAHASADERRRLFETHRGPLFVMGVVSGYMGAAPTLIWAASALTLAFAPLLLVVSLWLYTLVFAFAAAWFAHYALSALQQLRADDAALAAVEAPTFELLPAADEAGPIVSSPPAPPFEPPRRLP